MFTLGTEDHQVQENSIHRVTGTLGPTDISNEDLRTYLQIRKSFDFWAVCLECQNFLIFEKLARPDRVFEDRGRKIGLIHLGPNCFDFFVK